MGEGSPGRLFYGNRILPPGTGALSDDIDCYGRLRNHSLTQLKLFYLQLTTFLSRTAASIFGAETERSYIHFFLRSEAEIVPNIFLNLHGILCISW